MVGKSLSKIASYAGSRVLKTGIGLSVLAIPLPIVLVSFVPLLIYRTSLRYAFRHFKPSLAEIVEPKASIFAMSDINKSPKGLYAVSILMEGIPSEKEFKEGVRSTLDEKCSTTGLPLYPELHQSIVKFGGFWFWTPIENFRIEDQVGYHRERINVDEDSVLKLLKEECSVPIVKKKALWKLTCYSNVKLTSRDLSNYNKNSDNKMLSLIILTVHHTLVDGFSLIKLVFKLLQSNQPYEFPKPSNHSESRSDQNVWLTLIQYCLRLPYDIGDLIWQQITSKRTTTWVSNKVCCRREFTTKESQSASTSQSVPFELSIVRKISRKLRVSTQSVILTATLDSIRNTMFRVGKKIPRNLRVTYPYPLQNHPEKLTNHMYTGTILSLPLEEEDLLKRLKQLDETVRATKYSTIPYIVSLMGIFIGSLPSPMVLRLGELMLDQHFLLLNSFPAPSKEVRFYGGQCIWKEVSLGNQGMVDSKALVATFLSYSGMGRVAFWGDSDILKNNEMAHELVKEFSRSLERLAAICKENM